MRDKKRPIKPTKNELDSLLNCMNARANQAQRFLKIIAEKPDTLTGRINRYGGVNLSAVAHDQINPRIKHLGLYVDCRKPPQKIYNDFGEISNQYYWGIYRK